MPASIEDIRARRAQRNAQAQQIHEDLAVLEPENLPDYIKQAKPATRWSDLTGGVVSPDGKQQATEAANEAQQEAAVSVGADTAVARSSGALNKAKATSQQASQEDVDVAVARFNRDHFITYEGGKTAIVEETFDPELKIPTLRLHKLEGFRLLHAHEYVMVNGKMVNAADAWVRAPNARRFSGGMALLPNAKTPADVYNLYRGWGVTPQAGDASPALDFIREVICNNDALIYDYVVHWLAFCVQHPEKPAEVVLVLRGGRGTGKGFLGRLMCRLFGAHAMHVLQQRHLVGNFNAHLRSVLFMFADEAFFAGDRQAGDILKGIVTEDRITIERKGFDAYLAANRISILMATNHEWVVPAGSDERRFCVLDVADTYKQDHAYFGTLDNRLKQGGDAAFLDHLLSLDLSGFNIRKVPSTAALTEQKALSLPPFDQWLLSRLWEGAMSKHGEGWAPAVDKTLIFNEYIDYLQRKGNARYENTEPRWVGRRLQQLIPSTTTKRAREGYKRTWQYTFPPLDQARAEFERHALGGDSIDWPKDDEAPEQLDPRGEEALNPVQRLMAEIEADD